MKKSSEILIALTAMLAAWACLSNSVVFPDFDRFRRACPSPKVNAWKVMKDGVCYLATPAHVAIFAGKDGKWKLSQFLDDFKDLDWRIRHSYSVTSCAQDDICWAKYPGDDRDALVLEDSDITEPTKSYVVFRQPYDMDAVWVSQSEMGLTEAILYRSPRRAGVFPESDERPMLESMDIGFRGMSGAIAVNGNGRCLGMFVKRGKLIPLKIPRSAIVATMPAVTTMPVPQPSWLEQLLFPSLLARFDRMDAELLKLGAEVLKKEDLPELGAVFDARRGLFMPSTNILSIDDSTSISVKAIIGAKALEIPRF
jgi:hypothetical protein